RVTERPDTVAGELLEGRVAILAANTPFVLVVPATFWGHFQSPEDYYHSFYVASTLRLLRIVFAFLALTLPATYVAITTFHADMVPTSLLITIAAAREGVPFPALLDRKSTRLNSSHVKISYAVFCLKKKNTQTYPSSR